MRITKEMVNSFNDFICKYDTKIRLEYRESSLPLFDIISIDPFISNEIVPNITDTFREILEDFFLKEYDTEFSYNNTRTTCWSI